tara:strand:+ start:1083 stop:1712 length:630 start_codon:yes stop_codon:yes gene_type:complete
MESLNKPLLTNICNIIKDKKIKVTLEIGSRDGDDSNLVKNYLNIENDNVYIIEPNYVSYNNIVSKYPSYNVYDFAIHNYNGHCDFNNLIGDSIGVSSVKNRYDDFYQKMNNKVTKVKCLTGDSLLKLINKNIDYCQIDVEGLGYEVLESFGEKISSIRYILIESEHRVVWVDQKIYEEISNLLDKTHNLIFTDFKKGDLQSNSLWEVKK